MMDSFSFTLFGKHFICPSILNGSFAAFSFANRQTPSNPYFPFFKALKTWVRVRKLQRAEP